MQARLDKRVRPVHGILLVDKPPGMTSNRLLQRVKRLYGAAKAGHTGSLDPMATGLLPICFGTATRVSGMLLSASKGYRVTADLGVATDTGDADGAVIERRAAPVPDPESVAAAIESMRGTSEQIPPMYSALKHRGQRLYAIARRGEEVPRSPRPITIHAIELHGYAWPRFEFSVTCSKGTYVRSLVGDIADRLGQVGRVSGLRRTAVGPYVESQMVSLPELELAAERAPETIDEYLLGIDSALPELPALELAHGEARALAHGQSVTIEDAGAPGAVRVYASGGDFVGVGELGSGGILKPRKIFLAARLGEG